MPPRKKTVRKAVRKTKPKTPTATASLSDTETPTTDTPVSVPDTESPTDTPVSVADTETPTGTPVPAPDATGTPVPAPDAETPIDTPKPPEPTAEESPAPEPATTETLAEEPATAETLAEEPATKETLAEEPATTETLAEEPATAVTLAEEPATKETLAEEPATKETLAEEPATTETLAEVPAPAETLTEEPPSTETQTEEQTAPETLELETGVAAEEPVAETVAESSEPATKTKKVLRVRKVVKKKIVKKLVPKSSLAAAASGAAAQGEGKEVQAEAMAISKEQHELENPISDASSAKVEEVLEKANLGSVGSGRDGEKEHVEETAAAGDGEGLPERSKRKNTEVFVGGLDRDAKEDDLRKVFGKAGEIVEVRMIMDGQSGKNKGYAFVRYADASMAKKAVTDFEKVEVCGKLCGASALKDNDTIFLGNIDKKWKKEDIIKMLQEVGIEKIETVTVMADSNNSDTNRGYAFLELESNKDAQIAYKKLQKKDAFGKGRNIKVAWAEPLIVPDEEEVKKVKSVYVEGIPSSWDEEKVRETFIKFGEIERIVLACNMKSAKRKDFAFVNYTTREAALLCLESFDKESTEDDSKVTVKVSMAKPVQKAKQNKGGSKSSDKDNITEKPKAVQRNTKANVSSTKGKTFKGGHTSSGDKMSSTTHNFSHVIRQQATWKQGQIGYAGGPTMHDYRHGPGGKRPFSSLGDETIYPDSRGYQRARLGSSFPTAGSSYGAMPHGAAGSSFPYYQHQGTGYAPGAHYGATDYTGPHQMRQGPPPTYGSSYYSRY